MARLREHLHTGNGRSKIIKCMTFFESDIPILGLMAHELFWVRNMKFRQTPNHVFCKYPPGW